MQTHYTWFILRIVERNEFYLPSALHPVRSYPFICSIAVVSVHLTCWFCSYVPVSLLIDCWFAAAARFIRHSSLTIVNSLCVCRHNVMFIYVSHWSSFLTLALLLFVRWLVVAGCIYSRVDFRESAMLFCVLTECFSWVPRCLLAWCALPYEEPLEFVAGNVFLGVSAWLHIPSLGKLCVSQPSLRCFSENLRFINVCWLFVVCLCEIPLFASIPAVCRLWNPAFFIENWERYLVGARAHAILAF